MSEFQTDEINNQYILYDTMIPVCLNKKWGIFDISGNKLSEVEYDTIGCVNTKITDRAVNNVLAIGDSGVVVVSKDGVYGGISSKGDMLLPMMFEYIYSLTSGGETTYYIYYNGVDYKALDYINNMKRYLGYEEETDNKTTSNVNNNNANNTDTNVNNQGNVTSNEQDINQANTNMVDSNIADENITNTQTVNSVDVENQTNVDSTTSDVSNTTAQDVGSNSSSDQVPEIF